MLDQWDAINLSPFFPTRFSEKGEIPMKTRLLIVASRASPYLAALHCVAYGIQAALGEGAGRLPHVLLFLIALVDAMATRARGTFNNK